MSTSTHGWSEIFSKFACASGCTQKPVCANSSGAQNNTIRTRLRILRRMDARAHGWPLASSRSGCDAGIKFESEKARACDRIVPVWHDLAEAETLVQALRRDHRGQRVEHHAPVADCLRRGDQPLDQ